MSVKKKKEIDTQKKIAGSLLILIFFSAPLAWMSFPLWIHIFTLLLIWVYWKAETLESFSRWEPTLKKIVNWSFTGGGIGLFSGIIYIFIVDIGRGEIVITFMLTVGGLLLGMVSAIAAVLWNKYIPYSIFQKSEDKK